MGWYLDGLENTPRWTTRTPRHLVSWATLSKMELVIALEYCAWITLCLESYICCAISLLSSDNIPYI
jgi:hypothetical protein